ncbi:MAG TPA: sugar transferase, partial [Candidatus Hydrogenedentes bacterium]|nr:sugar transferase [Candidatus Hydrogenedentota bacterium]
MATANSTSERSPHALAGDVASARVDPSTWAVGWGRGRKWTIGVGLQILGEAVVVALAVVVAYLMYASWPPSMGAVQKSLFSALPLILRVVRSPEFAPYLGVLFLSPVIYILIFQWLHLYRQNFSDIHPFAALSTVLKGAALGTVILALLSHAYHNTQGATAYPALFFVYEGLLVFFGVVLLHSGTLLGLLVLHCLDIGRTRVALLCGSEMPQGLMASLSSPATSYNLVGTVTLDDAAAEGRQRLGCLHELPSLINRHNIDAILLALDQSELSTQQRLDVAQTCWKMGCELKMVTPFHPFFQTRTRPEVLGNVSVLHVDNVGLYATVPQLVKRAMDIAVSLAVLAALSPIMLAAAIAIKLGSPGPVFFVQERVGLNGRTFRMIKFRSMTANADTKIHQEYLKKLIQNNEHHDLDENGKPVYKIAHDPRITRVGHFIRRTSIDEMPQLFNVLRGEMTLVGPRPPIPYEVDEYQDWHMRRLHIRPGITGLWQVSGRNRLSFDEMVQLDIHYIEN